jgi:tetratricopeptide (TPR) repeat protein
MNLDILSLWNFNDPALSEARFREVLGSASLEDALILQTQIARTFGLRGDFTRAQEILAAIEAKVRGSSPAVQARYWLELGRTYSSATHSPDTQTEDAKVQARKAYLEAEALAKAAGIDDLAVDALHMLAFVDPKPEEQLAWDLRALEVVENSSQEAARKWEGSIRNNVGYALHQLGRYDEALQQFQMALAVRERTGNAQSVRIAYWMIAWTYRTMNRLNEALEIQLRLEKECETAGDPDPYVFEELEYIYRAIGNTDQAGLYAALLEKTRRT